MWVVVRITRHIGSVVAIFYPSREQSPYNQVGIMNSAALKPSQRTAQKSYWTRRIFPWINPRARPLLWFELPGFDCTWNTMEWIPSSLSMIKFKKLKSTSWMTGDQPNMGKSPSESKPLQLQELGTELEIVSLYVSLTWTILLGV